MSAARLRSPLDSESRPNRPLQSPVAAATAGSPAAPKPLVNPDRTITMSSSSTAVADMEDGEMSDDEQRHQLQQPTSFQVQSSDPNRPPRQITLARKGRGFAANQDEDKQERYAGKSGVFESLQTSNSSSAADYPVKSIGGYIVIVTNLHPETNDDDVTDAFTDFGHITTLHLNLDRRTGYVKGYALLEYAREDEARRAVEEGDGMVVMERQVTVDWALKKADNAAGGRQRDRRGGAAGDSAGGGGGGSRSRGGVVRRDYRDLGKNIDRGRDRGRDSGRDRDRERDG